MQARFEQRPCRFGLGHCRLFVRTGSNARTIPKARTYRMPAFTRAGGRFACKFSRFYIDEAQEDPATPPLTDTQRAALDDWEARLRSEQVRTRYSPGDLVFLNNFVALHGRDAFGDGGDRHLLRAWLTVSNSRPLAPAWRRQVFFRRTGAGEPRGGIQIPEVSW